MSGLGEPRVQSPFQITGSDRGQVGIIPQFGDLVRTRPAIQHVAAAVPEGSPPAIRKQLVLGKRMAAGLVAPDGGEMILGMGGAA